MKSSHIIFTFMVIIFLFFELSYAFLVYEIGDQHIVLALTKSAVLFLFIVLYAKKVKWAKWVLTILILINGLVCFIDAIENLNILFFAISAYSLVFIFCIHRLKLLTSNEAVPENQ